MSGEAGWDALALSVAERMQHTPWGDGPAVLCGVRLRDDGFVLVPFWSGFGREIPAELTPPDGCEAIVLGSKGWKAPLDDVMKDDVAPSEYPGRVRIYHTCIVYDDGAEVSVVSSDDEPEPVLMRGGLGRVLDQLRMCWSHRRR